MNSDQPDPPSSPLPVGTKELLPCPFCGETPEVDCSEDHSEAGQDTWLVCCGSAWCYGNAYTLDNSFYTRAHACEAWNARAPSIPEATPPAARSADLAAETPAGVTAADTKCARQCVIMTLEHQEAAWTPCAGIIANHRASATAAAVEAWKKLAVARAKLLGEAEQALAAEVEKRQKVENVLATIKDYVRVDEDFGADEIIELCDSVVGKFSQSKEWMMAGTYKEMEEDLTTARAEIAQTKAELEGQQAKAFEMHFELATAIKEREEWKEATKRENDGAWKYCAERDAFEKQLTSAREDAAKWRGLADDFHAATINLLAAWPTAHDPKWFMSSMEPIIPWFRSAENVYRSATSSDAGKEGKAS